MNATMSAGIKEMTVSLTVIRCGCAAPESHIDIPCPTPRLVEAPITQTFTSKEE